MISFLFLTIPSNSTYSSLKQPLHFPDDSQGVSNWVLRHPFSIYTHDLAHAHTFNHQAVAVEPVGTREPQSLLEHKWKFFVMTKSDGSRLYCTYHVFYQRGPLQTSPDVYQQFYLPKCLILMSPRPYFKLMANLIKIYHHLRHNQLTRTVDEYLLHHYQNGNIPMNKSLNNSQKLTCSGKKISCPIEIAFNYYIDHCNANIQRDSPQTNIRYVQDGVDVLHIYPLELESLYRVNYTMQLPIYGHTLAWTLAAILQEKQIIFVSSNQNSNVLLIQTLLEMVLPFKWECMLVPNLPSHMLEAAQESFIPYMVGVHYKLLPALSTFNRVVVHVDTNELVYNGVQVGRQGILSSKADFCTEQQCLIELPAELQKLVLQLPSKQINMSRGFNKQEKDLEWQSQIRVNCIMMMANLLHRIQTQHSPSALQLNNQYYLNYSQRARSHPLYTHIRDKTMQYSVFKNSQSKMHEQVQKLKAMEPVQLKNFAHQRMREVLQKACAYQVRDNTLQWVRYYSHHRQVLRENSLLRQSIKNLNLRMKQSLVEDTYSSMTNLNNIQPLHKNKNGELLMYRSGCDPRNANKSLDACKHKICSSVVGMEPSPQNSKHQYHSSNSIHPSKINLNPPSPRDNIITVNSARVLPNTKKNLKYHFRSESQLLTESYEPLDTQLKEKLSPVPRTYLSKIHISLQDVPHTLEPRQTRNFTNYHSNPHSSEEQRETNKNKLGRVLLKKKESAYIKMPYHIQGGIQNKGLHKMNIVQGMKFL